MNDNFCNFLKPSNNLLDQHNIVPTNKSCIRVTEFCFFEMDIVVIELHVMQVWFEIILVISNQPSAAQLFDFEIMISDQITLC
mgnify:CR=1 FL=1